MTKDMFIFSAFFTNLFTKRRVFVWYQGLFFIVTMWSVGIKRNFRENVPGTETLKDFDKGTMEYDIEC